jgi:hypothetical protein
MNEKRAMAALHYQTGPARDLKWVPGGIRNSDSATTITLTTKRLRLDMSGFEWNLYGPLEVLSECFDLFVTCQPIDFEKEVVSHFEFKV